MRINVQPLLESLFSRAEPRRSGVRMIRAVDLCA